MIEAFVTFENVVCPECGSDNYDQLMKTDPEIFLLSCNNCNEEFEVIIMNLI